MTAFLILILAQITSIRIINSQIIKLNETKSSLPTFTVNYNAKTMDLPVVAEHLTQAENVTCSPIFFLTSSHTTGYFGSLYLTPKINTGYIPFTCLNSGKRIQFHCHITGLINSSGNVGYLECRKPPVVSIVPDVVFLPKRSTPFTFKLQAILSEPTEGDAVEIFCNLQQNSGAKFVTDSLLVPPKTSSAALVINAVTLGSVGQIKFSCSAQSLNGTQYQTANSVGNSITMHLVEKTLRINPERAYLNHLDFKLSLIPNGITQDLSVVCQVSEAVSELDASNLLQNPSCLPPVNISQVVTAWKISPKNVDFKVSSSPLPRITLELLRNTYPLSSEAGLSEILVVTCCSTDDSVSPDLQAVARIDVLLPNRPSNIAEDPASSGVEVVLPNPAFTDITPCPCDVTPDKCDLSCCCDQLCPAHQPAPCFPGLFGGDFSNLDKSTCTLPRRRVSIASRYTAPIFLSSSDAVSEGQRELSYRGLRCVSANNGPVLGYFYPQKPVANIASQFDENYATRGRSIPAAELPEYGLRQLTEGDKGGSSAYIRGYALRVERHAARLPGPVAHTMNSALELAILVLPEPSNCDLPAGGPVNFLQNQERYQCPIRIDRTMCQLLHATESTLLPAQV